MSHYVKTTNSVLHENGFDEYIIDEPTFGAVVPEADADGKKEKKKRVHDPNAPKRPLTPFFLYMQTARPIIANDLGPDMPKRAVGTEGVRRWKEMADGDKQLWTNAYTDNLKLYNARMHAYKAGDMSAKDMTDEEAAAYAEQNQIHLDEQERAAIDAQLGHIDDIQGEVPSSPSSKEDSPPPAPKPAATPKQTKATGRAKKTKETPKTAEQEPIVPSSAQKESSPDKKRKRGKKEEEEKDAEKPKAARKKRSKGE